MPSQLSASTVNNLFTSCLYTDEEAKGLAEGVAPDGCIIGDGVLMKAGFHPGRLEEAKPELRDLLKQLPDDFHRTMGGGQSFLNLCVDKDGTQWGEHSNMDQLVCLSLATGLGSYCMARDMWSAFPGGMPYIVFDTEAS